MGSDSDTVRFTPRHPHLVHDNERAVIYFPHQLQDETERMFLLLAVLQTELHRQDVSVLDSLMAGAEILMRYVVDERGKRGCRHVGGVVGQTSRPNTCIVKSYNHHLFPTNHWP